MTVSDWANLEESFNRALELRDQNDLPGAASLLSALSERYPRAAVFGALGGVYFEMRDWNNAIACFRKASTLSPKSELASLGLFHSLIEAGFRDDAVEEMKRFLSISHSEEYAKLIDDM
jgi:tetratricopeptide (TPR) repeat protein